MTDEEREMIQKWLKARCSAQDCDLSDCKAAGCDFAICVRFASYGLAMADLLHEHARFKAEFAAFRKKWADRFGFIQSEHPADSIESIDVVANLLNDDSEKNG